MISSIQFQLMLENFNHFYAHQLVCVVIEGNVVHEFRRPLKTFLFGQWGHGAV